MKPEILIIAKYQRTLDFILKDIADTLHNLGTESKLDRENETLETDKFVIIVKTPYSTCIGRSWSRLRFYVEYGYSDTWVENDEIDNFTCRFPSHTKKIETIDEIIQIVRC